MEDKKHEKLFKGMIKRCLLYMYDEDFSLKVIESAMLGNETLRDPKIDKIIEKTASDISCNIIKDILIEDFDLVIGVLKENLEEDQEEITEQVTENLKERRDFTLEQYKELGIL